MSKTTDYRAKSKELLDRCKGTLAGGDSSSMRVLPYHPPLVADRGDGCRIWDVDGNEYLDLNMAYGPLLFGHRPPFLIEAVIRQLQEKGSQLGFPQELNFLVGEKIKRLYPNIELMRFANSGTEAMASASRLARAYTGRLGIALFEGHYHGWSDSLFHKYHAPLETLSVRPGEDAIPGTNGMGGAPFNTFVTGWNDIDALSECLERHLGEIAAVIMEPVMGNAGVIAPQPGYLEAVRELTRRHGTLLIFDEVITGMRVAAGGAQELYDVHADITVLSKALGGGFPVAAFGASAEIMDPIVRGEVFHGGVYSGNALVLSAANAVLTKVLEEGEKIYDDLNVCSNRLADGMREVFRRLSIPHVVQNVGPMIGLFLTKGETSELNNYREVRQHCDFDRYIRFQHALLDHGVYIHPNQFEPLYLSTAHLRSDVDNVLGRMESAIRQCLM